MAFTKHIAFSGTCYIAVHLYLTQHLENIDEQMSYLLMQLCHSAIVIVVPFHIERESPFSPLDEKKRTKRPLDDKLKNNNLQNRAGNPFFMVGARCLAAKYFDSCTLVDD